MNRSQAQKLSLALIEELFSRCRVEATRLFWEQVHAGSIPAT